MRRLIACVGSVGAVAACAWLGTACSSNSGQSGFGDGDDGGGGAVPDGGSSTNPDADYSDVGFHSDSAPLGDDGGGTTTTTIYANTDTELYSMDPATMAVTDIGPFQGVGGCYDGGAPAVTDLAVNSTGDVYVNTECAIYKATLPQGGTGPVPLTLVTTITSTADFYALAFAPAGVLGSGESLVAGDSNGDLWYIDTSTSNSTPLDLGGFGTDSTNNKAWELSGDIVFFTQAGVATGLATIRYKSGGSTANNDVLAGIDMTALAAAYSSHTPASSLNAGVYGSGTSFGDLFGIGAWENNVYAFSRKHGSGSSAEPAQLVQIGQSGTGMSLQTFSNITEGWSGAGVTTTVTVTIPNPPPR